MKVDLSTLPADCRVADIVAVAHALGHELSIEAVPIAPDESCEWVCPDCLETLRGSFPEVRDSHKCQPCVEIPPLSSYLRIGDVVDTPHGRSTVRTVGTKGVSGWRLVLCFQTVNVGDRLVDEGGKQWEVLETATENCSLLDGADAMRLVTWPDLDRDYKMLARSGKREDAE